MTLRRPWSGLRTRSGNNPARPSMKKPPLDPDVADIAPSDSVLTVYDEEHINTYLRLLDSHAEGADWREVARIVLHLDPEREPDRARRAFGSHLSTFFERLAKGVDSLLKFVGTALTLAQSPERVAEIVLRHRPIERHALAGPFLEGVTIGGDGRRHIHPPARRRHQIPIAPAAPPVPNFPRLRALGAFWTPPATGRGRVRHAGVQKPAQ
jgi:hypothetical protein